MAPHNAGFCPRARCCRSPVRPSLTADQRAPFPSFRSTHAAQWHFGEVSGTPCYQLPHRMHPINAQPPAPSGRSANIQTRSPGAEGEGLSGFKQPRSISASPARGFLLTGLRRRDWRHVGEEQGLYILYISLLCTQIYKPSKIYCTYIQYSFI